MKINISWVDKRHVVLRGTGFVYGAMNFHYSNEDIASKKVTQYLDSLTAEGYTITENAKRNWTAIK